MAGQGIANLIATELAQFSSKAPTARYASTRLSGIRIGRWVVGALVTTNLEADPVLEAPIIIAGQTIVAHCGRVEYIRSARFER